MCDCFTTQTHPHTLMLCLHKQTSMTRDKRWGRKGGDVHNQPLYDTSNALKVLKKVTGGGSMTRSPRKITPHLFGSKNNRAITKGYFLQN